MISIIVPIFGVEKYIERCLQSISQQTEKDFEVIVINDGTKDRSAEIVNQYMTNIDQRVKLISQQNLGVSCARNNGINHSKGDYICFVDSDDMIDSRYLEIMKIESMKSKADVVICASENISDEEHTISMFRGDYEKHLFTKIEALRALLYGRIKAGIWCLFIRREVLGGLRFSEGSKYSEDLEMVWKLVANSNSILLLNAPLYRYRVRQGSAMSIVDKNRMDGFELFVNLESFICSKAPELDTEYRKFGVSRWVWATTWQEAAASRNYKEFCTRISEYNTKTYMRKLVTYPDLKVRFSAAIFLVCRPLYYEIVKIAIKGYREINHGLRNTDN